MGLRIIMTGVSRGLGRAMTEGFAELGHTIVGCARSEQAISELRDRHSAPHRFDVVNVCSSTQVQGWANSILAEGPPPDLLINNAAIMNRPSPLWETSLDEFEELVEVNLLGVFYVIKAFLPAMVREQRGIVVNFSSGWGRSTSPEVASYCATKYAIEGLTLALAQELPAGMAAIPLNPGIINTDMLRTAWASSAPSYPTAQQWAKKAVPYILSLTSNDNGRSKSIPS